MTNGIYRLMNILAADGNCMTLQAIENNHVNYYLPMIIRGAIEQHHGFASKTIAAGCTACVSTVRVAETSPEQSAADSKVSRTMKSKFLSSRCRTCKRTVHQGEEIAKNRSGNWVCASCAAKSFEGAVA